MKHLYLSILALPLMMGSGPSLAATQTFEQTLVLASQNNPALQAERAKLRAVDEGVDEAASGWRPSIEGTAGAGRSRQSLKDSAQSPNARTLSPRDVGITVTQPVFSGFRTVAGVREAEAQVEAQRAVLHAAEQGLLLEAAKAYLDVVEAQKVRELMAANEDVLRQELEATNSRFNVGEVTKTDISQSEARLNAAKALRIQADGNLASRRATFVRVIGVPAESVAQPDLTLVDPQSLEDAIVLAEKSHPSIAAATYAKKAAKESVTIAQGSLMPEVKIVGSASRGWEQALTLPERQDSSTIMARIYVPLYKGGADYARSRAASETVVQRGLELEDARAKAKEGAIAAWQAYTTTRAMIDANKAGVEAAEMALHGVQEESKVGTRTVLDVLNARQELLNAQINLVKAYHDQSLAILQVKASIGALTSASLKL